MRVTEPGSGVGLGIDSRGWGFYKSFFPLGGFAPGTGDTSGCRPRYRQIASGGPGAINHFLELQKDKVLLANCLRFGFSDHIILTPESSM